MPIGGYAVKHVVLTSAARSTDGQSSGFNVGEYQRVVFYINVSAISGTGVELAAKIQESPDNSTWYDIGGLSETIMTTGQYRLSTDDFTKYIRLDYDIDGTTPSITFDVSMVGRA
jgi:hypothetical protein